MRRSYDESSLYLGGCGTGRVDHRRPYLTCHIVADPKDPARAGELTRNRRRREKLYERFIDEASRLYIDALGRDEAQASEQVAELVKIYSVVSQMRFLSSRRVIQTAENIAREMLRQRRRSRSCERCCIKTRSIRFASSAKRAATNSKRLVLHLADSL
jgi:hypothetical protein